MGVRLGAAYCSPLADVIDSLAPMSPPFFFTEMGLMASYLAALETTLLAGLKVYVDTTDVSWNPLEVVGAADVIIMVATANHTMPFPTLTAIIVEAAKFEGGWNDGLNMVSAIYFFRRSQFSRPRSNCDREVLVSSSLWRLMDGRRRKVETRWVNVGVGCFRVACTFGASCQFACSMC